MSTEKEQEAFSLVIERHKEGSESNYRKGSENDIRRRVAQDMGFIEEFNAHRRANPDPDEDQVNKLIEEWISRYPSGRRAQLEQQIRDPAKELDALTELWVYQTLSCLGLNIEVNPLVTVKPGADPRTPDFGVSDDGTKCYVEVTLLRHEPVDLTRNLESQITTLLRSIENSAFYAILRSRGTLSSMPKKRTVIKPVMDLLASYSPDEVRAMGRLPSCVICHDNWQMSVTLCPRVSPGSSTDRLSVAPPAWTKGVDDVRRFRKKLRDKSNRYPNLDGPLIVAINSPDLIRPDDSEEILQALLGLEYVAYVEDHPEIPSRLVRKGDGLWLRGDLQPKNSRVAAVWCWSAHPYGTATTPRLYINVEAQRELPSAILRMPHAEVFASTGQHIARDGTSIEDILGVGSVWPKPFIRYFDAEELLVRRNFVPTERPETTRLDEI